LVAEDGREVVFIEVRTRRIGALVSPAESITSRKQARIVRAAEHFLQTKGWEERPWRVDAVSVELRGAALARLEHLRSVVS
jgi:putative endonuclease